MMTMFYKFSGLFFFRDHFNFDHATIDKCDGHFASNSSRNYSYRILLILIFAFFMKSEGLSAASEFGRGFEENDSDQTVEADEDWTPEHNADLETTQFEKRVAAENAFFLQIGEATTWNSYGAKYQRWLDPGIAVSGFMGVGNQHRKYSSQSIDLNLKSENLGARFQWWPSQFFPFSFALDPSLHRWKIKTKCSTSDAVATCGSGDIDAIGYGIAGSIIVTWFVTDHIAIDWLLFGVKDSGAWKLKESDNFNQNAKEYSKEYLLDSKAISFANVSLGFTF
ncbi:MAG: hypothetical protein NT027_13730 [Proteobacteria bacterium]|nr:hypothetical protein [Pseudomonadota bacterium]